jgi:prolyl-tRNA synthetase
MAFIAKVVEKLVGADEVASSAKRTSAVEIMSYFFDKFTNQRVIVDARDVRPGDKQYHWEQRGVPFRIEVGPRDVAGGAGLLKRRLDRAKETVTLDTFSPDWLRAKLEEVHQAMFKKADDYQTANTRDAETYDQMKQILETQGGFVRCWFEPSRENEAKIKAETKATVRCIPLEQPGGEGKCVYSGQVTKTQVLFAQAY